MGPFLMDLLVSIGLTWAIMLAPMVLVRAVRRRAFGRRAAITIAVVGFFANHIVFALLAGPDSGGRLYVSLGAFVAYYVLTWSSRSELRSATLEKRRALGYED